MQFVLICHIVSGVEVNHNVVQCFLGVFPCWWWDFLRLFHFIDIYCTLPGGMYEGCTEYKKTPLDSPVNVCDFLEI